MFHSDDDLCTIVYDVWQCICCTTLQCRSVCPLNVTAVTSICDNFQSSATLTTCDHNGRPATGECTSFFTRKRLARSLVKSEHTKSRRCVAPSKWTMEQVAEIGFQHHTLVVSHEQVIEEMDKCALDLGHKLSDEADSVINQVENEMFSDLAFQDLTPQILRARFPKKGEDSRFQTVLADLLEEQFVRESDIEVLGLRAGNKFLSHLNIKDFEFKCAIRLIVGITSWFVGGHRQKVDAQFSLARTCSLALWISKCFLQESKQNARN